MFGLKIITSTSGVPSSAGGRAMPGIREPGADLGQFFRGPAPQGQRAAGAERGSGRWRWAVCAATWVLVGSAVRFGELVNAICHMHRGLLYDALGYLRPENKESERDAGEEGEEKTWELSSGSLFL